MQIVDFPIDGITVVSERELKDVRTLVESIREVGLIQPITVTPRGTLVAGRHRLQACKVLGWTTIPAIISDEFTEDQKDQVALLWRLAGIDENLIRFELTALERAELLRDRKEIYEQLHPEAPDGPGRRNGETVSSFTEDTAARCGLTQRTIQQDVQIAKSLTPEVKELVRDTAVADSKRELLTLARTEPASQAQVARCLIARESHGPRARTTYVLDGGVRITGPDDVLRDMVEILPGADDGRTRIVIETGRFEQR